MFMVTVFLGEQIHCDYAVGRKSQGSLRRDECSKITLLKKTHGLSYPFCVRAVSHNAIMLMSAEVGGGYTASKILQEQTCHFAEGMLHWNYAYEYNK